MMTTAELHKALEQMGPQTPVDAAMGVCTPNGRPTVHTGRKNGNQWWRKDAWHARSADANKTLCGIDCSEYLVMGIMPIDQHLCDRCRTAFTPSARPRA